jgi:hypothetical protein
MITEMETAEKAEDAEKSMNAEAQRRRETQRICRSGGHPATDVAVEDVLPPGISLRVFASPRLCVHALLCALNTLGALDPEPVR